MSARIAPTAEALHSSMETVWGLPPVNTAAGIRVAMVLSRSTFSCAFLVCPVLHSHAILLAFAR